VLREPAGGTGAMRHTPALRTAAAETLARESRDLPDERMVSVGAAESAFLDDGEHPRWRVCERPELLSPQHEEEILRAH
jgi:hypothetical protein